MEKESLATKTGSDDATMDELRRLREEVASLRSLQGSLPIATAPCDAPVAKELSPEVLDQRERFAKKVAVPGRNAPSFNLVNDFLTLGVIPWADPLVPAYLLDKHYRIVDWNLALSLAYDRTMEGRRGLSVLEWVYFWDNYEQSLKQAAKDFADPNNLPRLHVETVEYTSPRFGKIQAIKRAYQLPKDDGEMLGWLVTMETTFADETALLNFRRDLFATIRQDMTWSEYALSYDRVLCSSETYQSLLAHITGERVTPGGNGKLTEIAPGSRVLDLGAGTGNLAWRLASQEQDYTIFALENNRIMLDLLRSKCDKYLRSDDGSPGILAIKQDVNTLFGIPDGTFDYAFLNNVAYSLEDPVPCFRQVRRALKRNGEIRVSGPQKKTDLELLFAKIADDLKVTGRMTELQDDFHRVWNINRAVLSSSLYRWTVDDMTDLLKSAGFKNFVYSTDSAYAGQAMIVAARK